MCKSMVAATICINLHHHCHLLTVHFKLRFAAIINEKDGLMICNLLRLKLFLSPQDPISLFDSYRPIGLTGKPQSLRQNVGPSYQIKIVLNCSTPFHPPTVRVRLHPL